MIKIWIAGADGQVGRAINEILDPMEILNTEIFGTDFFDTEIFSTDREELDITNTEEVLHFGELNRPDVIINCAAVTDTRLCEEQPELAYRVNALGARNLSLVARKTGAKMVQMSTDDVFDGLSGKPYSEFDDTNPKTVYGRSKRAGENYVKEFTHKHFIIRSSWVYGEGRNFVSEVLESARNGKKIFAPKDQYGCPTSAKDLARLVLYLTSTNEYGTYHATCRGVCSRYEFAEKILELAGESARVSGVSENGEEGLFGRPSYGVLDNFILRILDEYEMPSWEDSLREYLKERKGE